MITFNQQTKIFNLTNGSISYQIYLDNEGYLETLYFGKAIKEIKDPSALRYHNIDNFATQYFDYKDQKEYTHSDHLKFNYAQFEVATHGKNDKRGAPIIIKKENGSVYTNFLFKDYEIVKGIPEIKGMPHANVDAKRGATLIITLKDELINVYLKYYISILTDCDIIIKNFKIENKSNENIEVLQAFSLQQDLFSRDYSLTHFAGCWSLERQKVTAPVTDGIVEIASNYGRSSHEENPFVYLAHKDATNENGEVIGFNLIYSGNFKFRIFSDYQKYIRVLYGINDEDFTWKLTPNNEFVTPQAVVSYSYNGVDKMSQNFHYFIKNHLITYKHEKDYKPILFNSWEGCYLTFNTETILSYIDDATKIGSELFVLDDGWFSNSRDIDDNGLGDWFVNEKKIDLQKVVDHCHKRNMKFGIWFEPEMVNPISERYSKDKNCILFADIKDTNLSISRHQFLLDFSQDRIVDDIYDQMVKIIDNYDIDYIKWDHNRWMAEHYSRAFPADQQGEIYHRIVLGYYKLIDRLTKRYPNIMFEGCSSGGGRFDMGTLYYTPQIWTSDESDPIQRLFIQYFTSMGYPLSTMGAHVNAKPITSYKTKAQIALFGTYGYEMNPNLLKENEIGELNEIAEIYKQYHKEVIEEGIAYHLENPAESNHFCMQAVSKDQEKSLVLFVDLLKEHDQSRFIKLKGLDPNLDYINSYDNRIYPGDYYMNVGLNFSREWLEEFASKLIILKKA